MRCNGDTTSSTTHTDTSRWCTTAHSREMLKHVCAMSLAASLAGGAVVASFRRSATRCAEGPKGPLDCEQRACKSRIDMMNKAFSAASASAAVPDAASSPQQCPLDKEELGTATWALLHTIAAHYPEAPTPYDQIQITLLLQALARFYPCPVCRPDFEDFVLSRPPASKSREELALWVCALHNDVSRKLGKDEQPCDLAALDLRWRENPACD